LDPAAPPWRALEEPGDRQAVNAAAPAAGHAFPRSTLFVTGGAVLLAGLAAVLAFGSSGGGTVTVDGGTAIGTSASAAIGDSDPASVAPELVVEIVGAVDRPGVFRLAAGSRVGDLVDAAGGYGPRVDADRASHALNLAAPLHDGDQVRVPSRDDPIAAGPAVATSGGGSPDGSGSASGPSGPIDLNRATSVELEALPGVGPVTAGKIIASRQEQAFAVVQDLRTRKLVGEKTFAQLKDLVTVR
jgi:competence protein ComEA